jgi:hypothetical protein
MCSILTGGNIWKEKNCEETKKLFLLPDTLVPIEEEIRKGERERRGENTPTQIIPVPNAEQVKSDAPEKTEEK